MKRRETRESHETIVKRDFALRRGVRCKVKQRRSEMQTIDEAKAHCRFVGKDIEKMVADGEDLGARFEGTQMA